MNMKQVVKGMAKEAAMYSRTLEKELKKECKDILFTFNDRGLKKSKESISTDIIEYFDAVSLMVYDIADEIDADDYFETGDLWKALDQNARNIITLNWWAFERDAYHIENVLDKFFEDLMEGGGFFEEFDDIIDELDADMLCEFLIRTIEGY